MTATIPPSFRICVPVYLGSFDRYDLDVDLQLEVEEGKLPAFTLRPVDLERVAVAACDAEIIKLREMLGEAWLVTRGTLLLG